VQNAAMNQSYFLLSRLLDNKYRLLQHGLFVTVVILFWSMFSLGRLNTGLDFLKLIAYSLTYLLVAYFNIYYLFKRFLLPGRLGGYVGISLLTFVISYLTQHFIYFESCQKTRMELTPSVPLFADMTINAITYCMFIGIGLSVKMIKMWLNSERKIMTLEQENLKANLNNLKSQINPHFLFNTFNNLYVLSCTDPKLASEMILGFADLMRYQLNECDKENVSIEKEIEYIENFLTLEKLRKDKLDLKIVYDHHSLKGIRIEPLLFVTLIENAVKHGSQQMENAFIHVTIERNNGTFDFNVTNSKPEVPTRGKNISSGKGIDNLRKRLNLSYPLRHTLELSDQKNVFTAKLQIHLS
jgi:two-component system, LytTR family, sensor kinase